MDHYTQKIGQPQTVLMSLQNAIQNSLYLSMYLSVIYEQEMVGLVIDEAHCVRKWSA